MKTVKLPLLLRCLQSIDFPHKLGICDRIFGAKLSKYGICWVQTAAQIPWKLDLLNPTDRWIVYGKFEGAPFLNWAKKILSPNGIVVDSGANIGQMLLYLSQWVPKGKVLAFEPGNEAADWLEECLHEHPILPVEVIRLGLGASPAQLYLENKSDNHYHGGWNQVSETEGQPIQIVRLEDMLNLRSIEIVDLWKLDVEGYEIPALQGAEALLKTHRIKALYVEMINENGIRILEYLKSFNYQCYLFNNSGKLYIPSQIPAFTNGLFLPV